MGAPGPLCSRSKSGCSQCGLRLWLPAQDAGILPFADHSFPRILHGKDLWKKPGRTLPGTSDRTSAPQRPFGRKGLRPVVFEAPEERQLTYLSEQTAMTAAHTVYLILGSNQGDRSGQLGQARRLLEQAGLRLRK